MRAFAGLLERWAVSWAVVIATLLLAAVCVPLSWNVEQDDDVLAFLPEGNAEIDAFYAINERFGGLDVALVGIESDHVFGADFLHRLKVATRELRDLPLVDGALSLGNIEDFVADPTTGGIVTSDLVDHLPVDASDEAALREKVMSRDHVVGRMVSADGKAVLIYAFGALGAPQRDLAHSVAEVVNAHFPTEEKFWGGAPFVATWIYDSTQADMARLTPYAVVAIVLIILVTFRDVVGSFLALFTTGMGILVSRAAMNVAGTSFNIVLSSMPVILFAVGSAYSIHMLSRFYALSAEHGKQEGWSRMMCGTVPVVLAAGGTTVAGLVSFVMMDIAPMRTFGLYTGLGVAVTLVLSVTFVPAVARLFPLRGPADPGRRTRSLMAGITERAATARNATLGLLGIVAVAGTLLLWRVDNRVDQTTFFAEGTPPDRAQVLLDTHFGGSQFLQVHVRGDLEDPDVLREVRRMADRLRLVPQVTEVTSIADPLAMLNDAMAGQRRLPEDRAQVQVLYRFLQGNVSVSQLVTDEHDEALLHVKIGSNRADALETVLDQVERIVLDEGVGAYRIGTGGDARDALVEGVALRVQSLARQLGGEVSDSDVRELLARPPPDPSPEVVSEALAAFLGSEECFVAVAPELVEPLASATSALGPDPSRDAWASALRAVGQEVWGPETETTVEDLLVAAEVPLSVAWSEARARALADEVTAIARMPEGARGERFRDAVRMAMLDVFRDTALVPDEAAPTRLDWEVSGLPVLYRGLSRSVTSNQVKSLASALIMVVAMLSLLYRSIRTGMLATVPTALTLLVIYGGMGALGVHLDIGTSMLASLIIGAGVDYAVHLVSAWKGTTPLTGLQAAVRDTAPAIWTNALMVGAGFFILTLGDSKPLQNVGGLTAAAMIVAAVATFLAIPALARRATYTAWG